LKLRRDHLRTPIAIFAELFILVIELNRTELVKEQ
jgi:hypothetical protein